MYQRQTGKRSLWRIGEIMLQKDWINWGQLAAALNAQQVQKELLGEILVQREKITPVQVLRALSIQCGVKFVTLKEFPVEEAALEAVPAAFVRQYHFMPLEKGRKYLLIAVSNPTNYFLKALLAEGMGIQEVEIVCSAPDEIEEAIKRYYSSSQFLSVA